MRHGGRQGGQDKPARGPIKRPPERQAEQRHGPGQLGVSGEVEPAVGVVDADEESQTARHRGPVVTGDGRGVQPAVQTRV